MEDRADVRVTGKNPSGSLENSEFKVRLAPTNGCNYLYLPALTHGLPGKGLYGESRFQHHRALRRDNPDRKRCTIDGACPECCFRYFRTRFYLPSEREPFWTESPFA